MTNRQSDSDPLGPAPGPAPVVSEALPPIEPPQPLGEAIADTISETFNDALGDSLNSTVLRETGHGTQGAHGSVEGGPDAGAPPGGDTTGHNSASLHGTSLQPHGNQAAIAAAASRDHSGDITGIALVVAVAVGLGALLTRLKQPPLVGYILAGIVLGPTGFGLVTQSHAIALLAELGVLMLLFIIGMELSLRAFVRVLGPATFVMFGQLFFAFGVAGLFGWMLEWPFHQTLLITFIIALSSTAVAMKMLDELGELRTPTGQITIGVMIAQDIAIVPMLILSESYGAGGLPGVSLFVKIGLALAILFGLIYVLSRRNKIRLPGTGALEGRVDLLALAALAFCFGAAAVSGLLGLSAAYGAFLAGLVISNATIRAETIRVIEPIQSILIIIFFLSIGLLIDLSFVWSNLGLVAAFTIGAVIVKSVVNVALLRIARIPWERALPGGLLMAQIGEFSFVLAAVGIKNGALDMEAYKLAISIIALTLLISPFWMVTVRRFHELASEGMTDWKAAMSDVVAEELKDFGDNSALVTSFFGGTRRRWKAAGRMRRMRAQKRARGGADAPTTADTAGLTPNPAE